MFTNYLKTHGIVHINSCPHTHEQNGVTNIKYCHVVEIGLTLLVKASMPLQYWDEAFRTFIHLINRRPTHVLHNKISLEFLFKAKPYYKFLKKKFVVHDFLILIHLMDMITTQKVLFYSL